MATLYSSKELGKGNNRLLMQGLAVMKKHGIAREMNRDSQELQHVVVEGATLKCSEGMRLHTLTIPSGTLETLGGKRVATIYHKELENISFNAFGTCKRKVERYQHTLEGNYKQCDCFVRASQPWESGKADLLPANQISLSTTSELICDEGGVISIVDDGQHSSEVMTMSAMAVTPAAGMTFLEWLVTCAGISQLDTPVPGPADVVAGVLVIGGVIYYGGKAIRDSLAKSGSERASIGAADIGSVAGQYGNGKCDKAAEAVKTMLASNNEHGEIITLSWVPNTGYVWSDIRNMSVGNNGFHMGVLYNGIVYCNIHPYGLAESVWINDFSAIGMKNVTKVPF